MPRTVMLGCCVLHFKLRWDFPYQLCSWMSRIGKSARSEERYVSGCDDGTSQPNCLSCKSTTRKGKKEANEISAASWKRTRKAFSSRRVSVFHFLFCFFLVFFLTKSRRTWVLFLCNPLNFFSFSPDERVSHPDQTVLQALVCELLRRYKKDVIQLLDRGGRGQKKGDGKVKGQRTIIITSGCFFYC